MLLWALIGSVTRAVRLGGGSFFSARTAAGGLRPPHAPPRQRDTVRRHHAIVHLPSGEEPYRKGTAHALAFLQDGFADRERGGFV